MPEPTGLEQDIRSGHRRAKAKVRFSDRIQFNLQKCRETAVHVIDEVSIPIGEGLGFGTHRILNWVAGFFGVAISRSKGQGAVARYLTPIVKIVFILPLMILILAGISAAVLLGGSVASIVGLRNRGDYSYKEQIIAWTPIALAVAFAPFLMSEFNLRRLAMMFSLSSILIGLNIIYGMCGILTLGHAAFVLTGAYFTTWFTNGSFGIQVPYLIAVGLAGLSAGLIGLLLGLPSLRVKDQYLLGISLAFTIALPKFLKSNYLADLSGFRTGGLEMRKPVPPEFLQWISQSTFEFYLVGFSSLILIYLVYNLLHHSSVGRAFRSLKFNDEIVLTMGISTLRFKLLAFSLSAMLAAVGGGFLTLIVPFVSPDVFGVRESIDYIVAVSVGGAGSILGSVLGAVFVLAEQDLSRSLATLFIKGDNLLVAANGVLLILMVYFVPRGIASLITGIFTSRFVKPPRRWQYLFDPPPDYSPLDRRKNELPVGN